MSFLCVFDVILVKLNESIPVLLKAVKNLLCFNIIRLSKTQERRTSLQRSGKTLCVHV